MFKNNQNGNYRGSGNLSGKKTMPGNMPAPSTARGGAGRAIFWSIMAVILLAAAWWWLNMPAERKGILRDAAAETVNDALNGTPLAGAGDILRESPQPPPPQVVTPLTETGTLSGRRITGTIASPIGTGSSQTWQSRQDGDLASTRPVGEGMLAPGVAGGAEGNTFSQEYMPPVKEDPTVRSTYLADLAQWLADRYRPGPSGGTLSVDARNINQLCGVELAARAKGGRSALLRYAFQPSMIQGLYNLYINQFMSDLDSAAKKRGFDENQTRDFHKALAGRVIVVANALDGIMEIPDLAKKLGDIDAASRKAVDMNAQLAAAVGELDELRAAKAPAQQINASQMRVDGITARYLRAMDDHAAAQTSLANAIRKQGGQAMDQDSLLFMAAWVERRMASGGNAAASIRGMSDVLRDLARRCSRGAPGV